MNEEEKNYSTMNGAKLEYSETEAGTYKRIKGLKNTPDIGGEPNEVDTTDLDNTEFETSQYGLKPAQKYDFEFNMENPSATANIKVASDLEDSKKEYYWKYTLSNGILVKFKSKVRTTIKGGSNGDLNGFTMHLAPIAEPTIKITEK